ncbi:aureocin A53 family class IId bacteriocin [Oceanobacillus luteolus]|uniref:Aureocin A53 family class IId bacteriocin n=1 Tax=Oceanobacillus luteolus TaxID=1274358 RepID=A0ABW4HMG6_9BACI
MAVFLRIVAQLSTRAAQWAWANRQAILEMIYKGVGISAIIDYINSRV